MADSIRGAGLLKADRALHRLEADPLRLERARSRFSHSPPQYMSSPSGTTTRSASPELPIDEQRRLEQREQQFQRRRLLREERAASIPYQQFEAEVGEESERIYKTDPRTSGLRYQSSDRWTFDEEARAVVKKCWTEEGIWRAKWGKDPDVRWKHEDPLELESELETDSEADPPAPSMSFLPVPPPKPKRPKIDDEKQRIVELRLLREREREASRPYHRFVYQVSKERKRIEDESADGESPDAADINTRAYEKIKNSWSKRMIWNDSWGILPGMSWKHEAPFPEHLLRTPEDPPVNDNPIVEEVPTRRVGLYGHLSPVTSNHGQTPDIITSSQQVPPVDVGSANTESGEAMHSPSASTSPRSRMGKRASRPRARQAGPPKRKLPPNQDAQQESPESATLGPAHPSKITKVTEKKRPGRRPNGSAKVSSGVPSLLSPPAIAEPLVNPQRRSKRSKPSEASTVKGEPMDTSTDSPKRTKRNSAATSQSNGAPKPQGISKRPRSTRKKIN